jgi:predicted secreted Zn-dependent protease
MYSKRLDRVPIQLSALAMLSCVLTACGESYPSQAQAYWKAAEEVLISRGVCVNSQDCAKNELIFWAGGNPWFPGRNRTYISLYRTNDSALVNAVERSIAALRVKTDGPPCRITAYSSAHNEREQIFKEVSIE